MTVMRPYIWLADDSPFPPVDEADEHGILALGGNLSLRRLVNAYSHGIFPWFEDDQPVIWWSPDPRFVLFPGKLRVSKSMRQVLNRGIFRVTYDAEFREVITECSKSSRRNQHGTWITNEMIEAYCVLHGEGLAHSVEVWKDTSLAGGLYGVSIGKIFCGESMFAKESNASKAGFITLVGDLALKDFLLIDSQVHTDHLESLGAEEISRSDYLRILSEALTLGTIRGNWGKIFGRV
jgi:leucyl/phenylalanyl-tRNA---protein transferase